MPLEKTGLFRRIAEALGTQSVADISSKLGVTKQSVYLWQKGNPPSLDKLIEISDSSGTSIHWLLTEKEPMKVNGPMARETSEVLKMAVAEEDEHDEAELLSTVAAHLESALRDYVRELVREERRLQERSGRRGLVVTPRKEPD